MNPILLQKIETLDLWCVTSLKNAGIHYVGELVQRTGAELLKVHNFGSRSLRSVEKRLTEWGLKLGMKIQWPQREAYDANRPSQDQYVGIETRYKNAVEKLRYQKPVLTNTLLPSMVTDAWLPKAAPPLAAGVGIGGMVPSVRGSQYYGSRTPPCPRHHTHHVWHSSTGPRCAICGDLLDGTSPPVSTPLRSILNWQRLVNAEAHAKGWYDDGPLNFGQQIALITSELSEALTEARNGHGMTEIYENATDPKKLDAPEGIPVEMADAVIRILDVCEENGIDLEAAMRLKHKFNEGRERRHGKKF